MWEDLKGIVVVILAIVLLYISFIWAFAVPTEPDNCVWVESYGATEVNSNKPFKVLEDKEKLVVLINC